MAQNWPVFLRTFFFFRTFKAQRGGILYIFFWDWGVFWALQQARRIVRHVTTLSSCDRKHHKSVTRCHDTFLQFFDDLRLFATKYDTAGIKGPSPETYRLFSTALDISPYPTGGITHSFIPVGLVIAEGTLGWINLDSILPLFSICKLLYLQLELLFLQLSFFR